MNLKYRSVILFRSGSGRVHIRVFGCNILVFLTLEQSSHLFNQWHHLFEIIRTIIFNVSFWVCLIVSLWCLPSEVSCELTRWDTGYAFWAKNYWLGDSRYFIVHSTRRHKMPVCATGSDVKFDSWVVMSIGSVCCKKLFFLFVRQISDILAHVSHQPFLNAFNIFDDDLCLIHLTALGFTKWLFFKFCYSVLIDIHLQRSAFPTFSWWTVVPAELVG